MVFCKLVCCVDVIMMKSSFRMNVQTHNHRLEIFKPGNHKQRKDVDTFFRFKRDWKSSFKVRECLVGETHQKWKFINNTGVAISPWDELLSFSHPFTEEDLIMRSTTLFVPLQLWLLLSFLHQKQVGKQNAPDFSFRTQSKMYGTALAVYSCANPSMNDDYPVCCIRIDVYYDRRTRQTRPLYPPISHECVEWAQLAHALI